MTACGFNGGWGVNGGFVKSAIENNFMPMPYAPTGVNDAAGTANVAALVGGLFWLHRPVRFNELMAFCLAPVTPPATGVIVIYQEDNGKVAGPMRLKATCQFTPVAGTTHRITPNEGTVLLSDGSFVCIWGQDSGAGTFDLSVYPTGLMPLATQLIEADTVPLTIVSTIAPGAPPAVVADPTAGGSFGGGGSDNTIPIIRLIEV